MAGPTEPRLLPPLPVAGSHSATPKVVTPEVTTPKVTTPKVATPEVATPEVTTPEVTTPEVTTPKVTTPKVTTPEVTTPEVAVPDRSLPVELRIPAIGVATSLSTLGLNLDGTVQVPIIPERAGWFRLGPTPGQVGSAVILGHVDSYDGPAVFYMLRYLQSGDRVAVSLSNGIVAHFVVTRVATYPNEEFPARQVYASHGDSSLQLVTCGGEFDTATGYQANVVIYTSLVGTTPAPV